VYVNNIRSAYNFPMCTLQRRCSALSSAPALISFVLLLATFALAQQSQPSDGLSITTKTLPAATLWNHYLFKLEATGGLGPYDWSLGSGSLPRKLELRSFGEISGVVDEQGTFELTIEAKGRGGAESQRKKFDLRVETPLTIDWSRKIQVNGQRIDGTIKVSNNTGRDFDVTFDVLAVNEIGRATAIGYQHFSLKKNTRDLELPFGDTLSRGAYVVHVDVVGEEPVSNLIFRSHLVTSQQVIAQGP
jgi:Putative Ig domain